MARLLPLASSIDRGACLRERSRVSDRALSLKDMTRGSGCTPRTVRYYERQGLLRAVRTAVGHRLFAPSELERLHFIIDLREAGWSLEEVTTLLSVRDSASDDHLAVASLANLLEDHVTRLQHKLRVLQALQADFLEARRLLPVCERCTEPQKKMRCDACTRVPALEQLPRSFRLLWRARELDPLPYDDAACDRDALGSLDDADDSDDADDADDTDACEHDLARQAGDPLADRRRE